jgi:hypothetical protein
MTWMLAISAAYVATALALAARRSWGRRRAPRAVQRGRVAQVPPERARDPAGGRCVLCHAPLASRLLTREELIARVEHRIDTDTAAVAELLSSLPPSTWARSIGP